MENEKEITINDKTYVLEDQLQAEVKTVGIAIKNRWTGSIIFQSTKATLREAVLEQIAKTAIGTDANLTGADLTGAKLTRANLTRANLTGANLTRANLTRADLTRADLTGTLIYLGSSFGGFPALCKAIKTIKWNDRTGSDFIE